MNKPAPCRCRRFAFPHRWEPFRCANAAYPLSRPEYVLPDDATMNERINALRHPNDPDQ